SSDVPLTITLFDDTKPEGDETFTVTLSDAIGATLGAATAAVTILDDELALLPPHSVLGKLPKARHGHKLTLAGTATPAGGLTSVQIAIVRFTSGKCLVITSSGRQE